MREGYVDFAVVDDDLFDDDLLNNSQKRWDAMTFDQQQHAIWRILKVGGIR